MTARTIERIQLFLVVKKQCFTNKFALPVLIVIVKKANEIDRSPLRSQLPMTVNDRFDSAKYWWNTVSCQR